MNNSKLMHDNNIYATPAIVYKDAQGTVRMIQGMPSEDVMRDQIFPVSP